LHLRPEREPPGKRVPLRTPDGSVPGTAALPQAGGPDPMATSGDHPMRTDGPGKIGQT